MSYKLFDNIVCCISDLHIGVHTDSPIWHNVALEFAEKLKKTLDKKGIRDIVISGDIFHNRSEVSVETLHVANKFFTILKDFNIIAIIGNHDAYFKDRSDVNSISIFNGWNNITVLSELDAIEAFGKKIVFAPWATEIESIPECDIIFGHFEITSFKMNKAKICVHGTQSSELLKKADLVISGHFHLRDERKYENGTILYLGSPYEMDWGDHNTTKGIYLLNVSDLTYEFIENLDSPKHKKFKLSDILANNVKLSELKQEVPNHFISFIVDAKVPIEKIETFINKLSVLKPLSIKVEYNIENNTNIDETAFDYEGISIPSAIEDFVNMLDIPNKKEVIEYTLELYKRVTI